MNLLAAKDKEVGVFGDNAVYNSVFLQICQLRIGFVGSDNKVDSCSLEGLNDLKGHLWCHIHASAELVDGLLGFPRPM